MPRRRSALYVPASNTRALDKARSLPCDVLILDLEDAVAPEAKMSARQNAATAVRSGGFIAAEIVVRINGLDTEWGAADVAAVLPACPTALLLPKVDGVDDLRAASALLAAQPQTTLWAMIETPGAMLRLDSIAGSGGPLRCLVAGTNDLTKEAGMEVGADRHELLPGLFLLVMAARAHGLAVLDGVCNELNDPEGLTRQCRQARAFGFDGKTLIHPDQIEPCHAAFAPDAAQVAAAQRIVAAFADPSNAGRGALRVDGRMVERLHLMQARRTLRMAGLPD
ncbi:MAG: CoA ester lyase [Steroidobacteraceae bacterium]